MGIQAYNHRVVELVDELLKASKKYYSGQPNLITDAVYDMKCAELKRLDPSNRFFDIVQTHQANDKVYHSYPMLSIQKALDLTALEHWYSIYCVCNFSITPKLDGMSIEISFKDGIFSASTRGDGEFGEDMTERLKKMLPVFSNVLCQDIVLRGELCISKDSFVRLNNRLVHDKREPFVNSRNAVGGIFNNQKDGHKYYNFIDLVIYEVLEPEWPSYDASLIWFAKWNRDNENPSIQVVLPEFVSKWGAIENSCRKWINDRSNYKYQIDGLVVRLNSLEEYNHAGRTGHHRKGSIAFKFPAQFGTVIIKSIDWSCGSHEITPVANFEPILLAGANLGRASLHNIKNMVTLGAGIGSVLTLTRQGDVIPKLWKTGSGPTVDKTGRQITENEILKLVPNQCPACSHDLQLTIDLAHLTCPNPMCEAKFARRIEIFAKALGIEYVGPGVASKLATILEDVIGLLWPDWDIVASAIGSRAIALKIKDSVNKISSRPIPAEDFIASLNLGIGVQTVRMLFHQLRPADCLTGYADFASVRGVSRKGAVKMASAFVIAENYIRAVKKLGIIISFPGEVQVSNIPTVFFCVTGTMSKKRSDLVRELESHGWKFKSGVSSAVQYLICNDTSKSSSKLTKARKLGVRVLSESDVTMLLANKC